MSSEYLMRFSFHFSYPLCDYRSYLGPYKPLSMPKYLPLAQFVPPPAHQWMLDAGDIHTFPKKWSKWVPQIKRGGHFVRIPRPLGRHTPLYRVSFPTYVDKRSYTSE